MSNILAKIKEAGLVGRGGAGFPTWKKWEAVAKAVEAGGGRCFVVCNFSEGEPGVKKDRYIFERYGARVIDGMNLAIEFLGARQGYIYINHHYHKELGKKLEELVHGTKIEIFVKPEDAGYIGGEESSALNVIEGKKSEPRLRPPFPVEKGLWDFPTLVNNVETFFNVSQVNSDEYKKTRFYTIGGQTNNEGVFELPEGYSIETVLRQTDNYPNFPFFIQVGGDGSGEILNDKELDKPAGGAGSITIHKLGKEKAKDLFKDWISFFYSESCGQCTACREGTYRIHEILESDKPNWTMFFDLLTSMRESAFCGLGTITPAPIFSYLDNILCKFNEADIDNEELKAILKAYKNK